MPASQVRVIGVDRRRCGGGAG